MSDGTFSMQPDDGRLWTDYMKFPQAAYNVVIGAAVTTVVMAPGDLGIGVKEYALRITYGNAVTALIYMSQDGQPPILPGGAFAITNALLRPNREIIPQGAQLEFHNAGASPEHVTLEFFRRQVVS